MTKILRIVENNHITGVVYGTVEVSETQSQISHKRAQKNFKESKARIKQIRNRHHARMK
jgi:hypothetical protein